MLRFALIALVVIITALFGLSLLPQQLRDIPDATINLENTRVILYPQEDPDAVWFFSSPSVSYDPDIRETTLNNIEDGERVVSNETDFTLAAEKVVISSDDNLRGDSLFVHIIEEDYDLDMTSKNNRQVIINQREGQFDIPRAEVTGEGELCIYENMRISFDLESFESGGEGSTFRCELEIVDGNED